MKAAYIIPLVISSGFAWKLNKRVINYHHNFKNFPLPPTGKQCCLPIFFKGIYKALTLTLSRAVNWVWITGRVFSSSLLFIVLITPFVLWNIKETHSSSNNNWVWEALWHWHLEIKLCFWQATYQSTYVLQYFLLTNQWYLPTLSWLCWCHMQSVCMRVTFHSSTCYIVWWRMT